jgi:Mn2+/Fe2+ NRAMP family transporter
MNQILLYAAAGILGAMSLGAHMYAGSLEEQHLKLVQNETRRQWEPRAKRIEFSQNFALIVFVIAVVVGLTPILMELRS